MTSIAFNRHYQPVNSETLQKTHSVEKGDNRFECDHIDDIDTVMRDIGDVYLDTDKVVNVLEDIIKFPKFYIISDDEEYIAALVQNTKDLIDEVFNKDKSPPRFYCAAELLLEIFKNQNTKRTGDCKANSTRIDMRWGMMLMQFTTKYMQLEQAFKSAVANATSTMHSGLVEFLTCPLQVSEPENPVFKDDVDKNLNVDRVYFNSAVEKADNKQKHQIYRTRSSSEAEADGKDTAHELDVNRLDQPTDEVKKSTTDKEEPKTEEEQQVQQEIKEVAAAKATEQDKAERLTDIKNAVSKYDRDISNILSKNSQIWEYNAEILTHSVDNFKKVSRAIDRQNYQDDGRVNEDKIQVDGLIKQLIAKNVSMNIVGVADQTYRKGQQA